MDTSYADIKLCVAPLSTRATAAVGSCAQSELHTPSHYGDILGYQSAFGLGSSPSAHDEHPCCICTSKRNKCADEAMVETPPVSMAGEATVKPKLLFLLTCPVATVHPKYGMIQAPQVVLGEPVYTSSTPFQKSVGGVSHLQGPWVAFPLPVMSRR